MITTAIWHIVLFNILLVYASAGLGTIKYEIPLVSMVVPIAPILLNSSRL